MTLVLMLACGSKPALLPSVDPAAHSLLADAPADATLLASLELAETLESPLLQEWRTQHALELERLDTEWQGRFGATLSGTEQAVLGCNEAGCSWQLRGDYRSLDLGAVGAQLARPEAGVNGVRQVNRQDALLFRSQDGTPLRLQRVAADRVLLGHGPAVKAQASATTGLGVAGLEGAIPQGDLWVVARDPEQLREQVLGYLAWRDTDEAREGTERVEALWADRPELVDDIELIALSLSLDEPSRLAVRASCWDVEGAERVFGFLEPLLAAQRLESALDPRAKELLGHVELVREGRRVELRTQDRFGILEFLLSVAGSSL